MNTETPKTLQEAIVYFADPDKAHSAVVAARWPNGIACPHCGTIDEHTFLEKYYRWKCKGCKKQFTVKLGTIFEDSPLKLGTWLAGMWMIAACKNGISSYEIHRALGITQKSAWFLLHRVRLAMQNGSLEMLPGPVEADETYIGGKAKNKHASKNKHDRGVKGKEIVMGILQRGTEEEHSKVRAKVIPNTVKATLQSEINANVVPGAVLNTDAHAGYQGLSEEYKHAWVDHLVQYAEGSIHTNGTENFWSLFKRMLGGTYTHVDPRHLQAYVDEETYRFNNHKTDDADRFAGALGAIHGKRLTYDELCERGLSSMLPK